ncbi:MAG: hypothetical protein ACRC92_24705 [Peptostreptococcaceae bacterium]
MQFTQIGNFGSEAPVLLNNGAAIKMNINNNNIIYSLASQTIVRGEEAKAYVKPMKLEFWNNGSYDMFDVAFKLENASEETYGKINAIEVRLLKHSEVIARRITSDGGINRLKEDDIFFGGLNGELNCSFKARENVEVTSFWKSSSYDLTTPDKVEIRVSMFNKNKITTYVVESDYIEYDLNNVINIEQYR